MCKVMMVVSLVFMTAGVAWANTATFDNLPLGANGYWNGSDGSGGFSDGGAYFNNVNEWGSWSGFAYSNVNDTATPGFVNQYAAYTGTGVGGGGNYAVGCVSLDWMGGTYAAIPIVASLQGPAALESARITNTTYAALSMLNGDGFAKEFGGASGDDPDWFKLIITGKDAAGAATGSVDFYLADYRGAIDYIVDTWQTVDLSALGTVSSLEFSLASSDVGLYGINTPTYFAMDNLTFLPAVAPVPEPATWTYFLTGGLGVVFFIRREKVSLS